MISARRLKYQNHFAANAPMMLQAALFFSIHILLKLIKVTWEELNV